jgi:hypothetical protein
MNDHKPPSNVKLRPTLQQLATIAVITDGGGCPKCGCKDSRMAMIGERHYRVCRHCGHRLVPHPRNDQ